MGKIINKFMKNFDLETSREESLGRPRHIL
jgi:hypothetical protein